MSTVLILAATIALSPVKKEVAVHANLAIYPLYETGSTYNPNDYITLDEGLKQGTVVVTETGGGNVQPLIRGRQNRAGAGQVFQQNQHRSQGSGTVNTLWLLNKSNKKLLILTGEMVSGGKQDRIIQKDVLIPPSKEAINLSVFCVEQNRWSGQTGSFSAAAGGAGGLADPSLRGKAQHERNQSAVWGQVDKSLGKLKTDNATKTYQANLSSPTVQRSVDAYVKGIQSQLHLEKVTGVAVAINGKMVWMDNFAGNPMFRKYWPKMIRSYALEAMQAAERAPSKPPQYEEAMRYAEARDGKKTYEAEEGVWKLTKIESSSNVIYELEDLTGKQPLRLHSSKMAK